MPKTIEHNNKIIKTTAETKIITPPKNARAVSNPERTPIVKKIKASGAKIRRSPMILFFMLQYKYVLMIRQMNKG